VKSVVKNWKAPAQKRVKAIPSSGPITTVDITQKSRMGMTLPGGSIGNTKKAEKDKNEMLTLVLKSGISIFHKLLAVLRWKTIKSGRFSIDSPVIHLKFKIKNSHLNLGQEQILNFTLLS